MNKIEKLLELYKKLTNIYEEIFNSKLSVLSLNNNYYELTIAGLKYAIKELENKKEN